MKKQILLFLFINFISSCTSQNWEGKVEIDSTLDEVSAIETTKQSNYHWVIQDAGNDNILYGLDKENGDVVKEIEITNAKNKDWEELSKDEQGNLYIGDIGSNSKKRNKFTIYKIKADSLENNKSKAETIEFKLPNKKDEKDFEAFFLFKKNFYVFSKEEDETFVYKIPNIIGEHKAVFLKKINLKAKNSKVTSADISPDGDKIVLLNHNRIWLLEDVEIENFNYSNLTKIEFNHDTQKEGICFSDDYTILITDERHDDDSFIYTYKLE
jgi:hypothetical protein